MLPIGSAPIKIEIEVAMTERVKDVKTKIGVKLKTLGYLTVSKKNLADGNYESREDRDLNFKKDEDKMEKENGVHGESDRERGGEEEVEKEKEKERGSISMSPTTSDDFELVCHTDVPLKQPVGSNRDGGYVDLKRKATATARLKSARKDTEGSRLNGKETKGGGGEGAGKCDGQEGDSETETAEEAEVEVEEEECSEKQISEDDMVVVSHPQPSENSGTLLIL